MSLAPTQYPLATAVSLVLYPGAYDQPDGDVTVSLYSAGTTPLYSGSVGQTATAQAGSATTTALARAGQKARTLTLDGVGTPAFRPREQLLLISTQGQPAEVVAHGINASESQVTLDQAVPWDVAAGSTLRRYGHAITIADDEVTATARSVLVKWSWVSNGLARSAQGLIDFVRQPFVFDDLSECELEQLDHTAGKRLQGADRWRSLIPGSTGEVWLALEQMIAEESRRMGPGVAGTLAPDMLRNRLAVRRAIACDVLARTLSDGTERAAAMLERRDVQLAAAVDAWIDFNEDDTRDAGEYLARHGGVA